MTYSLADLQHVLRERYHIERELGAGGMAVVYLARDARHDRLVAIKVLRPELAAIVGGERFLKEIRTTANLQHPHILPLHDSGESDGVIWYVMPFMAGESLRDRLRREKQLPIEDALRITREVASGLDYAHRHGVVHRDIKPENILLHDERAMVADFGIALAVSRSDGGTRLTETGLSLGTPYYMSPEQAMGEREITPKSDVYSLGCVLYEMLAGEPPFTGPSAQAIIARVITEDPRALTVQRRSIPPSIEAAVNKALAKLPADRFTTAAQFADALSGHGQVAAASTPPTTVSAPARSRGRRYAVIGGAALVLLLLGAGASRLLPGTTAQVVPPARLSIQLPAHTPSRLFGAPVGTVALSPDGSLVAYVSTSERGPHLLLRRLDDLAAAPVSGTVGATDPVFSADGSWLSFISGGQNRKVPVGGGSPVAGPIRAGAFYIWVGPDEYLFTGERGALSRMRGADVHSIAEPDTSLGEIRLVPTDVLPDGRILTLAHSQALTGAVWLIDPRNGKRQLVTRTLVGTAAYHDGHIAWVLPTGALVAARWDERSSEPGTSHVIASNVRITPGAIPQIAFSRTGSLVYVASQPADLVRVDRNGQMQVIGGEPRRFHSPRVSPDGSRVAMDVTGEIRDVWVLHLRDGTYTRLTFDEDGHDPMWMPDGRSVLYATARGNSVGIHRIRVGGGSEADSILHRGAQITAHAATPDGRWAVAAELSELGEFDLVRVELEGDRRVTPLLATRFDEAFPTLSPDGRWLAYASDESGRPEVYVRELEGGSGRVIVSRNGGSEPVWSRDGREIFYRDLEASWLMSASVELRPEFRVTSRVRLFDIGDLDAAAPHANYDVTPDGAFVFVRQPRVSELMYVQNWPELVRRRSRGR
jgi:eukaryotic-like serine/threonine-protein kinase